MSILYADEKYMIVINSGLRLIYFTCLVTSTVGPRMAPQCDCVYGNNLHVYTRNKTTWQLGVFKQVWKFYY